MGKCIRPSDCCVCGGEATGPCEFCPRTPGYPRLREAVWDYWAAGLKSEEPLEIVRECELLELHVLPRLGHLRVDQITNGHRDAVKVRLLAAGATAEIVTDVMCALSAVSFFYETGPNG